MAPQRQLVTRAVTAFFAVLLGLGVLSAAITATAEPAKADTGYQYLVPDPGMWCNSYAQSQLGNTPGIDINYYFVGFTGSKANNDLRCKIIVSSGGDEDAFVPAGVVTEFIPVNFAQACRQQYGNDTGITWLDPSNAYVTSDPQDDWLYGAERGWFCVGWGDRTYDQSSYQ